MTLDGTLIATIGSPIKTSVYSTISFPPSLKNRIVDTLSWKNRNKWITKRTYEKYPEVYLHGTRSLGGCVEEDESRVLSNGEEYPFRAFQLKGSVYVPSERLGSVRSIDIDNPEVPNNHPFTVHDMKYVTIDETGKMVKDERKDDPKGTMIVSRLGSYIENLKKAKVRGLVAPRVLGYGIFDDLVYDNEQTGFVILGVYEPWNARLLDFFQVCAYRNNPHFSNQELSAYHPVLLERLGMDRDFFKFASNHDIEGFGRVFNSRIEDLAVGLYRGYGKGLFNAHKKKMVLYNPHMENVLPLNGTAVMYDWEFSRDVSNDREERQVGFFALDIRNAINHLGIHLRSAIKMKARLLVDLLGSFNPVEEIMKGYGINFSSSRFSYNFLEQSTKRGIIDPLFELSVRPKIRALHF